MEELLPKLLEHGLGVAILAYAWWRAEERAAAAQQIADSRADAMAKMMVDQVATNEKVVTAQALNGRTCTNWPFTVVAVGGSKR